jgi:phage-related protein
MPDNDVKVIISARDEASAKFNQINNSMEKFSNQLRSLFRAGVYGRLATGIAEGITDMHKAMREGGDVLQSFIDKIPFIGNLNQALRNMMLELSGIAEEMQSAIILSKAIDELGKIQNQILLEMSLIGKDIFETNRIMAMDKYKKKIEAINEELKATKEHLSSLKEQFDKLLETLPVGKSIWPSAENEEMPFMSSRGLIYSKELTSLNVQIKEAETTLEKGRKTGRMGYEEYQKQLIDINQQQKKKQEEEFIKLQEEEKKNLDEILQKNAEIFKQFEDAVGNIAKSIKTFGLDTEFGKLYDLLELRNKFITDFDFDKLMKADQQIDSYIQSLYQLLFLKGREEILGQKPKAFELQAVPAFESRFMTRTPESMFGNLASSSSQTAKNTAATTNEIKALPEKIANKISTFLKQNAGITLGPANFP